MKRTPWWLTIELPHFEEVSRYYRWHIDKNWCESDSHTLKRVYNRPAHRPHISIIRGERPRKNIDKWHNYLANEKIEIYYEINVRQTTMQHDGKDHFWFINAHVDDKYYSDMRKFFGLDYEKNGVPFHGHITIARSY